MDLALRLDPLNPFFQVLSGIHLIWVGRIDDAIERLRTTFAKTPGFGLGHTFRCGRLSIWEGGTTRPWSR